MEGRHSVNDLISRAAAIAQIKENYCHWCDHIDLCQSCETQDCIATIEQQVPAVDAVPVVHGRWTTERTLKHDGEWYCSVCEYEPIVFIVSNYCPNCGAIMDGDT